MINSLKDFILIDLENMAPVPISTVFETKQVKAKKNYQGN